MMMKKTMKTWISLILSVLLLAVGTGASAEGGDGKEEWLERAIEAFEAWDDETALYYFTLAADAGDPNAQYMTASCYYIFAPCSWQPATGEGHLIA